MYHVAVAHARVDCTQKSYDGRKTTSGKLFCGPYYYECGDNVGNGCCSLVMVSPLQLTLVILGPASLLCSIAFLAFIIKVVLQTRHEDDGVDTSAEVKVF
ncbi:uncharacterized protein LOC128219843 isoform X2 [Mya arenaria]|nr:uncharacterized protein LOC128219843 isoform X2 [Mya arenaria]XP_052783910.1 uncharacterized protein LOC128219843 isoform X2 [Mya arenaria]